MNADLVLMALIAGAANYAYRVLPITLRRSDRAPGPRLAAFLAAVGPAAIATLATASILPMLSLEPVRLLPLLAGTATTLGVFATTRSVAAATLLGALAFGLAVALA